MMGLSTERMNRRFGRESMSCCIEVIERFRLTDDGTWALTYVFTYDDGTSQEMPRMNDGHFVIVPAVPGWHEVVINFTKGPDAAIERRPVIAWKYDWDGTDSYIVPLREGNQSYWWDGSRMAYAVQTPDGRVISHQLGYREPSSPFDDQVFESVDAWAAHERQRHAERLKKEAEEKAERERRRCPHCGADPKMENVF